jgi:hypothetical protein
MIRVSANQSWPLSVLRWNGRLDRSAKHDVADELGADMLGLGLHLVHQPGALDDVGEAGIVLDIGGDGQLAARLDAGDQHGLQQRAGGIDGGGVAGGARSNDQAAGVAGFGSRHGADIGPIPLGGDGARSPRKRGLGEFWL